MGRDRERTIKLAAAKVPSLWDHVRCPHCGDMTIIDPAPAAENFCELCTREIVPAQCDDFPTPRDRCRECDGTFQVRQGLCRQCARYDQDLNFKHEEV
jgi:ribosomal protein S27E